MEKSFGKTIKCKLKDILDNDPNKYKLFKTCIYKGNDLYFICSYFIKCYVLYCFEKNLPIPKLNYDFIRMVFKAISKKSKGPKPKDENLKIFNELNKFFQKEFVYLLTNKTKIKRSDIEDFKFDSTNLSYIINLFAKEMNTSYTNHVKLHFFKYLNQFVNQHFIERKVKRLSKSDYKKLSINDKNIYKKKLSEDCDRVKEIKNELFLVKEDILSDESFKSDKKYHKWIKENKSIILPKLEGKNATYEKDINKNHFKYLKCMLEMNKILEKNNKKMFSSVALRTQINDKYVHFDTSALKDIFGEVQGGKTNSEMWNEYFNINLKKFKLKGYSFNHQISTDGFAVSINFINNDEIESNEKKKKAKSEASKKTKRERKTKTETEIAKDKKKKVDAKTKKEEKNNKKNEEIVKEVKKKYKMLPDEEKEKIKLALKLKNNKYEYLEDAVKDEKTRKQLEKWLEEGFMKVGDPGMNAPLTIYGGRTKNKKMLQKVKNEKERKIPQIGAIRNNKILFSYRGRKRIRDTRRRKYIKLIDNKKKKTRLGQKTIKELENELSKMNGKTVNYKEFKKYAKKKMEMRMAISNYRLEKMMDKINKINEKIVTTFGEIQKEKSKNEIQKVEDKMYAEMKKMIIERREVVNIKEGIEYNAYVKKLKWYGYINTQRHEDELLNELEKVYGKEAIFIIGDWSNRGRIRKMSMPNKRLIRLLATRFKVFLIDEYKTSKIHYKTKTELKNLEITKEVTINGEIKKYKEKKHQILTYKMGNESGCINRDYNACRNMYLIMEEIIKNKKRPKEYKRENPKNKKLDDQKEKHLIAAK